MENNYNFLLTEIGHFDFVLDLKHVKKKTTKSIPFIFKYFIKSENFILLDPPPLPRHPPNV